MEKEKVKAVKESKDKLKEAWKDKDFSKATAAEKWDLVEQIAKMLNIID